jgi:hypothetical protein
MLEDQLVAQIGLDILLDDMMANYHPNPSHIDGKRERLT